MDNKEYIDDSPPHLRRICKCGNRFDQIPPDDSGIIELECRICREENVKLKTGRNPKGK